MNEPWFDPNLYAWIPGTAFGCVAGLWGSAVGLCAQRGKAEGVVMAMGWCLAAVALAMLAVAVTAWALRQPYGIWYGLGLPGLLGTILLPSLMPVARNAYRQAQARRMQAADL